MSEIANASINTFGISPKADFEPPSEQHIIISLSDLSALITQAVEKAIQPLQDEVSELKATVARLDRDNAALQATQNTHEDNQLIQLRLINELRESTKKELQPLQKDRGEILRALLAANGGKMLAKDARQKMRMSKQSFTNLLAVMDKIETKPLRSDKRQNLLVLK